ncbi:Ig-like domain-containing protein [uncultured Exiguobacterium sp.]|uniref:Ig-like domain-containing protein n=1 Tax=uncultured Exiguobacterium sp. TaxID=202669 RepID=UPI0025EB230B|nr:Ig-like domain-containing protein [uncultured Exiguobacterium sp.]
MGTKKSNKLYAAAAALAVTASAVAPGLTADAASKVTVKSVTNPASISHYGGYTFAVKKLSLPKTVKVLLSNKKYENRSVKWGKVSYDKKYIGKYQTISGTVSGTTKKASIKVKLNNYPVDVVEPKLAPVAVGEKLNLPSTIDVKYKDGKVIARSAKSFNLTAEKTDKAGEMKLSYNYMGKNSSIKGSIAYEVKAAEITNVMNEIKDDMLSVSADVKYPAKDAKAEVLVYAFKDMTKEPIKVAAELKDGKLTAKSAVLPAGTHAFAVKVGEVVSPAKDFVIEAPMVKEVKAINAKQLQVTFNKAVDKATVVEENGTLKGDVVTVATVTGDEATISDASLASLSTDGKVLTISTDALAFKGKYVVKTTDAIKTAKAEALPAFTSDVLNVEDTTRPMYEAVSYDAIGNATFTFSEPLNASKADIVAALTVSGPTSVAVTTSDITLAADQKSFTVALPVAMTLNASYNFTFTGLKDFGSNLLTPNPVTVSVVKKDIETVKPTIVSIESAGDTAVKIKFSEKVQKDTLALSVDGVAAAAPVVSIDETGTVVTVKSSSLTPGLHTLDVTGVKDLAGNVMDAVKKVVEMKADTIAPAFVSQDIVKKDSKQYLVVKYDEVVAKATSIKITGTYVDNDKVTKSIDDITEAKVTLSDDKMSVWIELPTTPADYTLNLPKGLVVDASAAKNESLAKTVTFKLNPLTDTTKPAVVGSLAQANNKVTVTFDRDVTAATALNTSNYVIEGAEGAVESAILKGNAHTVELTLKNDAISTNGTRNVTIKNVATAAGSVMDTVVKATDFKETVRPVALSAKLLSATEVEITFSENIKDGSSVGNDVDVFQGSTTALTETKETITGNKLVVTLPANELKALTGITVKASANIDITDANNNVVNFSNVLSVN